MDSTGTMGGSRLGPPAMPPSQMAGGLPQQTVFIPSQPQQDGSGFGSQQKPVKGALNEPIPNIKGMEEREEGSFRRWLARANRPIVWRFLTFVLSAVAFCTMASARYYDMNADVTRRYTVDRPLTFLMSINVITMVWSFYLFLADVLAMNRAWRPSETTKFIMPDIVLFIDTCLIFLMFGASCTAAGRRDDWRRSPNGQVANFCSADGTEKYCRKTIVATVFSFVAWLFMLPSWYINTAWRTTGPW